MPVPAGGPGESAARGVAASAVRSRLAALILRDRIGLGLVLVVAAVARLPGLSTRGSWDSDQGHDMLVLRGLVVDGIAPLLGPPTSIGDFHHGALYYYLLGPAAALGGADPTAVLAGIALAGITAVAVTWWLARAIGGPIAALVAGGLMAVSPSAVETSTFIWNPNLIPLAAAIGFAAAWRARSGGRARWWAVAIVAAGTVMQLHVLGAVALPAVLAAAVADAWRPARLEGGGRGPYARRVGLAILAALAILATTYLPLLIHELRTDWSEMRNVVAFLSAEEPRSSTLDPLQRLLFSAIRIVGWPLVGLVTSAPLAAVGAVAGATGLAAWRLRRARGEERTAVAWLIAIVLWSVVALTAAAPSLATVIAGLPNDHYHAFLDPAVFILVGLGIASLVTGRESVAGGERVADRAAGVDRAAGALAVIAVAALVIVDVTRWPPSPATDGGWPAAEVAGARIVAEAGGGPIELLGLPRFKTTEGVEFPLRWLGARIGDAEDPGGVLLVVCDRLFEPVIHDPCGGPAEERLLREDGRVGRLVDRFDLSDRTSISIYRPVSR